MPLSRKAIFESCTATSFTPRLDSHRMNVCSMCLHHHRILPCMHCSCFRIDAQRLVTVESNSLLRVGRVAVIADPINSLPSERIILDSFCLRLQLEGLSLTLGGNWEQQPRMTASRVMYGSLPDDHNQRESTCVCCTIPPLAMK